MTTKSWIKFFLLSIFWGSNFLWIRIIVTDIGPFILVFFRVLFAFLTILIYIIISKTKIILTWRKLGISVVLGFFNVTLPFLSTSWAEQFISSGLAGMISSTYPLFALLFAAIILPQERLSWFRAVGLLIGFCGAVILTSIGFTKVNSTNILQGVIVMFIAPISYSIAIIFAKITTGIMDIIEQSLGQIFFALITVSLSTILFESHLRLPSQLSIWMGLLLLGVFYTGVGTILYFSLLNSAGITITSLIAYISPVIAVILGILILSEAFTWQLIVGGFLVIIGLIWVNSSGLNKKFIPKDVE